MPRTKNAARKGYKVTGAVKEATMSTSKDTQPFRLLDLPPEIKVLIYGFAWRIYSPRERLQYMAGNWCKSCSTCNDTYWDCGVSSALWALSQTCREIYVAVLPLVYKGVHFKVHDCSNPGKVMSMHELEAFSQKARLDLITSVHLIFDVCYGVAKKFAKFVDAFCHFRNVKHLYITFIVDDIKSEVGEVDESAELELMCQYWQNLLSKREIYVDFTGLAFARDDDEEEEALDEEARKMEAKFGIAEENRLRSMSDSSVPHGTRDHDSRFVFDMRKWVDFD
ncbi:hypothetical protein K461DRAFT_269870 [Myriangium duriaei CBS 260.36]|uniref:Uncharacterized protein n=1 Tax=Myriangium duriaei CBS 260.36 TaxID=1168546 RepID=A0A9P4IZ95_9PEZI|nr:hypothetical protein K461DRAFT_269870 [Myriangium duriaei CBS 260.36]